MPQYLTVKNTPVAATGVVGSADLPQTTVLSNYRPQYYSRLTSADPLNSKRRYFKLQFKVNGQSVPHSSSCYNNGLKYVKIMPEMLHKSLSFTVVCCKIRTRDESSRSNRHRNQHIF